MVTVSFDNGEPPLPLVDLRNGQYSNTWNALLPSDRVKLTFNPNGLRTNALELTGSVPATGAPLVFRTSAVNGANFLPNVPLAPGSIFSVFGGNLAGHDFFSTTSPLSTTL